MPAIHREMQNAEKRFDQFVDAQKKEELAESDVSVELDRLIAQVDYLVDRHLKDALLDLPEKEAGLFTAVDLDLSTITASSGFAKQVVATASKDSRQCFPFLSKSMPLTWDEPSIACRVRFGIGRRRNVRTAASHDRHSTHGQSDRAQADKTD